jgi:DNA-binding CsgD family transcriptional regulator
MLTPHICKAISVADLLDMQSITTRTLEATLDQLAAGVFLVAASGRVVFANRAGEALSTDASQVTLAGQRLQPSSPLAAEALAAAIAQCNDRGAEARSVALPALLPGEPGLIATVLPLRQERAREAVQPLAAVAAVFIRAPGSPQALPETALRQLYGLTAAELRVAVALSKGQNLQDVADTLGITRATAKAHLAQIFQKTGTDRQSTLVALLARAGAVLR